MPSIGNSPLFSGSNYAFKRTARWVEYKESLSDQWVYLNYVYPVNSTSECAPGIGSAEFIYDFGYAVREGLTTKAYYNFLDLRDKYVRIMCQVYGEDPYESWIGVIVDQDTMIDRSAYEAGQQKFTAKELSYILSRRIIDKTYLRTQDNSSVDYAVDMVFNRRSLTGRKRRGNRSTNRYSGVYRFAADREIWAAKDVIEYLLHFFNPFDQDIVLAGDLDSIESLEGEWDLFGKDLWSALNEVVRRELGMSFVIEYDEDNSNFRMRIFTVTNSDITYGQKTLKQNGSQVSFSLPAAYPYNHLVDNIEFRLTTLNQYDDIEIRGEKLVTAMSLGVHFTKDTASIPNGYLGEDWTQAEEDDYIDGGGLTDPDDADRARSDSKYEDVFSHYKICAGKESGLTNSFPSIVVPEPNVNGDFRLNSNFGIFTYDKRFDSKTFFVKGTDYSSASFDYNDYEDDEEYVDLIGIMHDLQQGDLHDPTYKAYMFSDLGLIDEGVSSISVSPLNSKLGVKISCPFNHYISSYSQNESLFSSSATRIENTNRYSEFAIRNITITGCVSTDAIPRILINVNQNSSGDIQKRLVINAKGAEYWYVPEGTVYGVENGSAKYCHSSNRWVRKDRDKLDAYAAFATAWYTIQRQAVSIPIKNIGRYAELGSLLTSIDSAWNYVPVNTVVTSRAIDYADSRTLISTGWGSADYAPSPVIYDTRPSFRQSRGD